MWADETAAAQANEEAAIQTDEIAAAQADGIVKAAAHANIDADKAVCLLHMCRFVLFVVHPTASVLHTAVYYGHEPPCCHSCLLPGWGISLGMSAMLTWSQANMRQQQQ